jgi:hypothetical protein
MGMWMIKCRILYGRYRDELSEIENAQVEEKRKEKEKKEEGR